MSGERNAPDWHAFFERKYARTRATAARRLERAALGHEVGLNGYTTLEQAHVLCGRLDLPPGALLLDVGAGRGWPGSHVARTSGCRLVSTDVPWDALLDAKARHAPSQAGDGVVAADGGALPFRTDHFDGIVHADVLC